jgi:hypothetical protein
VAPSCAIWRDPGSGDAAELRAFVPREYQRVGGLIKTAKIKAD